MASKPPVGNSASRLAAAARHREAEKKESRAEKKPSGAVAKPAPKAEAAVDKTPAPPVKKKGKKPTALPSLQERAQMTSAFMRATISEQAKKTGQTKIYVGGEAACMMLGVPLPSFALEYLFGLNILPFGILLLLVGEEGIGKSGLSFEIARWFRRLTAAQVLYMDNESKYSDTWANSILGWDDPQAMKVVRCSSMKDWQTIAQDDLTRFKALCDGTASKPGHGKIFGYLQILDTLMGKATPESQKRIEKEGFAGRNHPDEARSITQLLRTHPSNFVGWPAVFLVLNQLKVKTGDAGRQIREMAGGSGMKFQVSYQFELKRNPTQPHLRRGAWSISRLRLRSFKNAFAEDYVRRETPINVCVRHIPQFDAAKGEMAVRQETVWDWYGATTELLLNLMSDKVRASERLRADGKKKLRELLPIREGRGGVVSCETLGVTKDDPVSPHALGRMIQQNKDVLRELRNMFGIQVWPGFDPSVSFDEQVEKSRQLIAARLQKISKDHVMTADFDRNLDDSFMGGPDDGDADEAGEEPDPEA